MADGVCDGTAGISGSRTGGERDSLNQEQM